MFVPTDKWRDDNTKQSVIVYYVLFVLFALLFLFGVMLLIFMIIKKKIKP